MVGFHLVSAVAVEAVWMPITSVAMEKSFS